MPEGTQGNLATTPAEYARRAWAVLIVAARHRETIPYSELKRRISYPGTAQSARCVLYRIKHYCAAQGLPRLAALVVYASGPDQGRPGDGADADPSSDPYAAWDFDWMSCQPIIPDAAALELAHAQRCVKKRSSKDT